jgi:ABC-type amino acid transport system permease subunit
LIEPWDVLCSHKWVLASAALLAVMQSICLVFVLLSNRVTLSDRALFLVLVISIWPTLLLVVILLTYLLPESL